MSGRTEKAARKAEQEKQKDFITRKDAFLKMVKEASLKYRLDLVGTLHYESNGAFPAITIVDIKDNFGQVVSGVKKDILVN